MQIKHEFRTEMHLNFDETFAMSMSCNDIDNKSLMKFRDALGEAIRNNCEQIIVTIETAK